MDKKIHSFTGHNGEVFQVEWSPHAESVFGSCSSDRRVHIWDLAKVIFNTMMSDSLFRLERNKLRKMPKMDLQNYWYAIV